MKGLVPAIAVAVLATPALAQEDARFASPPPVDFTKPFVADAAYFTRRPIEDQAIPVEVIGRDDMVAASDLDLARIARALASGTDISPARTSLPTAAAPSLSVQRNSNGRLILLKDGQPLSPGDSVRDERRPEPSR